MKLSTNGKVDTTSNIFDEWWQKDMANMILRDRNHPSIILWSIGNEVGEASRKDNEGIGRATMLRDFVHKLEPSRLVTLAAQNNHRRNSPVYLMLLDIIILRHVCCPTKETSLNASALFPKNYLITVVKKADFVVILL